MTASFRAGLSLSAKINLPVALRGGKNRGTTELLASALKDRCLTNTTTQPRRPQTHKAISRSQTIARMRQAYGEGTYRCS